VGDLVCTSELDEVEEIDEDKDCESKYRDLSNKQQQVIDKGYFITSEFSLLSHFKKCRIGQRPKN